MINAEYLSFPTIFVGQKKPDNREQFVNVSYSDICKYELHCIDRHAARNVPNLFFKFKKLQMKHISPVQEAHKQYVQHQIHRHSRIYCIENTHKCRISFPIPQMSKTVVFEPIGFESEAEENMF